MYLSSRLKVYFTISSTTLANAGFTTGYTITSCETRFARVVEEVVKYTFNVLGRYI